MKIEKPLVFHPFLFAIFPSIFLFSENLGHVFFYQILLIFIIILARSYIPTFAYKTHLDTALDFINNSVLKYLTNTTHNTFYIAIALGLSIYLTYKEYNFDTDINTDINTDTNTDTDVDTDTDQPSNTDNAKTNRTKILLILISIFILLSLLYRYRTDPHIAPIIANIQHILENINLANIQTILSNIQTKLNNLFN